MDEARGMSSGAGGATDAGTTARFERLFDLFDRALEASPTERGSLLAGVDEGTRLEVERLLELGGAAREALEGIRWELGAEAAAEETGLAPGTRVGEFTVLGVLGRGGSSVVYRARQEEPRREIALKIPQGVLIGESQVRRFQREARALGMLRHPGIAQVYSAGTFRVGAAEVPYFAMELVEGRHITAAAEGLGRSERLEMLARVCDAVEHAHRRGVIHRDLKASNILVEGDGRVRVLDFGIALLRDPEEPALTSDGRGLAGTPLYMSPEQLEGGEVDTRSDLYSLGILAYEVLTGVHPFAGAAGVVEAARARRAGPVAAASKHVRELRGDVEAVLGKALEAAPDERYQGAGLLAADLRAAARGEPVTARPPSFARVMRVYVRRHRVMASAAGAAALTLAAGGTATAWQAYRAAAAESRSSQRAAMLDRLARALLNFSAAVGVQPGALDARDAVLNEVLPAMDELASQNPDDVALQRTLANAYGQMARQLGSPRVPNLGQHKEAVAAFHKAIALMERYGSDEPRARLRLAGELGETCLFLGDAAGTDAALGMAYRGYRSLWEAERGNAELLYLTAEAGQRRVQSLFPMRDKASTQEDARELSWVGEHVRGYGGADAETLYHLSMAMLSVGVTLRYAELPEEAIGALGEARALAERAMAGDPTSEKYEWAVLSAMRHIGLTHHDMGRSDLAVEPLRRCVEAYRERDRLTPNRMDALAMLATGLAELSTSLAGSRRHDEAPAAIEEALAIYDGLLEEDPENRFAVHSASVGNWMAVSTFLALAKDEQATKEVRLRHLESADRHAEAARMFARRMDGEGLPVYEYINGKVAELQAEAGAIRGMLGE